MRYNFATTDEDEKNEINILYIIIVAFLLSKLYSYAYSNGFGIWY